MRTWFSGRKKTMTLGFSTNIKGMPTYFVDKIWSGLATGCYGCIIPTDERAKWIDELIDKRLINFDLQHPPKIHTIRADDKDRWKEGRIIHFVINNRTKDRYQFAPELPVMNIQMIEFKRDDNISLYALTIYVDGRVLSDKEVEELAVNDGFDTMDDFFSWFNKPFVGKIIHWTDKIY